MKKFSCAGTGLISLDLVIGAKKQSPLFVQAGGSCGNVLSILAYLGWDSHPFARFNDDTTSHLVMLDLSRWGVNCENITKHPKGSTPCIVHRIGRNAEGKAWHRFEWYCPQCGKALPRFRPILSKDVSELEGRIPSAQVFYFDRVSRGTIKLAKMYKEMGALVFLEPTSVQNDSHFVECLGFVDVIKYATGKRIDKIQAITDEFQTPLEIVTLGEDGVEFRKSIAAASKKRKWCRVKSHSLESICDTAGAGDWCSATLIDQLIRSSSSIEKLEEDELESMLITSQAFSAINCLHAGARGAMYSYSSKKLRKLVSDLILGIRVPEMPSSEHDELQASTSYLCPNCS